LNDDPTKDEQSPQPEPPDAEAPAEPDAEAPPEPEAEAPAEPEAEAPAEPEAEAPAEPEPEPEAPAEADAPAPKPAEGAKAADQPPGAELDPIALEPEVELDAEERARIEAEAEERARREAEREQAEQPVAARPAKLHADSRYVATGKRKSSVARVILSAGSGAIQVNSRKLEEYFPRSYLQSVAKQPLVQTGYEESVDVRVRVHGGGVSGQASAVRHGIARALCDVDPELRRELKRRGMLTRDARIKERRKAGLKKARKRPQFSKR
jgi:small subunit ribosomal protein S9